jgi:hypothetical protein
LKCCHFNFCICDTDAITFFIWKNINLKFFLFSSTSAFLSDSCLILSYAFEKFEMSSCNFLFFQKIH